MKPATKRKPRKRRAVSAKRPQVAKPRRLWVRIFLAMPGSLQALLIVTVLISGWFAVNWSYHIIRKPSELFFPVSGTLNKTPA